MHRTLLRVIAAVVVYGVVVQFLPLRVAAEQAAPAAWLAPFRDPAAKLMAEAQANDFAWRRLAELTDTYGARISGSENLNRAIRWAQATMKADGFANVRAEKVMVPVWVRGPGKRGDRRPARASHRHAGPRRQRGHPAGRHRGRRARGEGLQRPGGARRPGQGQDRALQRALHDLRRDRGLPRRAAPRRRPSTARSPHSCARWGRWRIARRTPAA